jgi:hypothetical protein
MAFADICCEELLGRLKNSPKQVTKWIARNRELRSSIGWTCEATSSEGDTFIAYMRQNKILDDDFSCGIVWKSPDGEQITIARYNGSSHNHTNKSDGETFVQQCHIHQATVMAVQRGWSVENYAVLAESYTCLDEAKLLLASDYVISGLVPDTNQLPLWS